MRMILIFIAITAAMIIVLIGCMEGRRGTGMDDKHVANEVKPLDAKPATPGTMIPTEGFVFTLNPEREKPFSENDFKPGETLDVNVAETLERRIEAIFLQVTGASPSKEDLEKWNSAAGANPRWRRIDLAMGIAQSLGRNPKYVYSDPWNFQPRLLSAPDRRLKREIGAVCMFFFNCPDGHVNSRPSWANNHVPGMDRPAEILKMDEADNGYYNPRSNPGFWFMELLDARYAGLQFLLLNTYGPDISDGSLDNLVKAMDKIESMGLDKTVKIGLFDDTWSWGTPWFGEFWKQKPDMEEAGACAKLIFEAKWKPFFSKIPRRHWHMFKERPVIAFYNAGTIRNRYNAGEVFKLMKKMFKQEFGVEPFLLVDAAFWRKEVEETADSMFKWYSLGRPAQEASFKHRDIVLTHAMVRWDSTARDNGQNERIATEKDKIFKDDRLLLEILDGSRDSDILLIATWNDLGEGTGINRCYDYYWNGKWREPTHFMELIRKSQGGEILGGK